jgi:hypothetical protein
MALPQMDSEPSTIDPGLGAYPITTATTVCGALAALRGTGDAAGLVYRAGQPRAVVTVRALTAALTAGHADATVGSIADYAVVPVDRHADAFDTVRVFDRAAWDWLRDRRGAVPG